MDHTTLGIKNTTWAGIELASAGLLAAITMQEPPTKKSREQEDSAIILSQKETLGSPQQPTLTS